MWHILLTAQLHLSTALKSARIDGAPDRHCPELTLTGFTRLRFGCYRLSIGQSSPATLAMLARAETCNADSHVTGAVDSLAGELRWFRAPIEEAGRSTAERRASPRPICRDPCRPGPIISM